ncbi:MAG: dipeptidase, partial [Anaerococcus hydrogenalis]|nr:dipeptidase [Anaerococcus hydrogenalis]
NNPVKISVPKKGFEKQPTFDAKDSKIEVKEDSDSYVFETEKTSLNYKNDGEKSENKDNKEEKTESNDSSNEKKDEKKSDKKSNKGLIIGAIVVIAALVAFFKKKK